MAYTKVPKPGVQVYTKPNKPTKGFTITAGMATGLIISPTYPTTQIFGKTYTNVAKPVGISYTKINKPT
jgi:hypothetical protein